MNRGEIFKFFKILLASSLDKLGGTAGQLSLTARVHEYGPCTHSSRIAYPVLVSCAVAADSNCVLLRGELAVVLLMRD